MGRMAQAYKQKLQKVCRLHCALAPRCTLSVVESKLKKITQRDPGTKDLFMICDIKVRIIPLVVKNYDILLHTTRKVYIILTILT